MSVGVVQRDTHGRLDTMYSLECKRFATVTW
jgi:hypothetical protein